MKKPKMKNMTPCNTGVEGSMGTTRSRMPARGTPDAELICESMIRPALGMRRDMMSPIFPPNRPPRDVATEKTPSSTAVVLCENPISSSHIDANASAAHGKLPATPCATKIWNVRIWHTCFASTSMAFRPSQSPCHPPFALQQAVTMSRCDTEYDEGEGECVQTCRHGCDLRRWRPSSGESWIDREVAN